MRPAESEELDRLLAHQRAGRITPSGEERIQALKLKLAGVAGRGEAFGLGVGRGMLDMWQGTRDLVNRATEAMGITEPGSAERYRAEIEPQRGAYDLLSDVYPVSAGAGRLAGNVAATPIPGAWQGTTAARLGWGAGAGAAAGGLAYDPDLTGRMVNAGFGAAGGALGQGLADVLSGTARSVAPNAVSDTQRALLQGGQSAAADTLPVPTAYHTDRWRIPQTRGQNTGSVALQQNEQRQLRGAFGDRSQQSLEGFLGHQQQRMRDAYTELERYLAGLDAPQGARTEPRMSLPVRAGEAPPPRMDQVLPADEAGARMREALSGRASSDKARYRAAFEAAENSPAQVPTDEAVALTERLRTLLGPNDLRGHPDLTARTRSVLDSLAEYVPEDMRVPGGTMDVQGLHDLRMLITDSMEGASNRDMRLLGKLRGEVDRTMEELLDNGALIGDPAALEGLREGIRGRAQYGRDYGARRGRYTSGDNVADPAGKIMQQIAENQDLSGEEVVNLVFGKGRLGANQNTRRVLDRIKSVAGEDSAEWQMARNMAMEKLRRQSLDVDGNLSPRRLQTAWTQLRERNRDLLDTLLSPDGQATVQTLVDEVAAAGWDARALNPSGTAHMIERMAGGASPAVMGVLGALLGDMGGMTWAGAAGGAAASQAIPGARHIDDAFKNIVGPLFTRYTLGRVPPNSALGVLPIAGAHGSVDLLGSSPSD